MLELAFTLGLLSRFGVCTANVVYVVCMITSYSVYTFVNTSLSVMKITFLLNTVKTYVARDVGLNFQR